MFLIGLSHCAVREAKWQTLIMQIIRRVLSNLEDVKSLTGHTRDVVVEAYVRSFGYTRGRDFVFLLYSS